MKTNLTTRTIEVIDYDPNWTKRFELEKQLLTKILGSNAVTIEHIGSTSVFGLAAKPVIDILIEVTNLDELDTANNDLALQGYVVKGENGISGRRYFQKGGVQRSHHVHAFQSGNEHLLRHRAFKEYLIAYPNIASQYGEIKKDAALKCHHNTQTYMALKNDFIEQHEKLAVQWFSHLLASN